MASVSVIITCFNLERYIAEAIQSALGQQGVRQDVEIIVIDDASTDSSVSIVERFESVRLVRMERNSGVMLAMLRGIEEATGEIVFFLDGDDIWEADKLAETLPLFDDPGVVLATHDLTYVDARGSPTHRASRVEAKMATVPPERWSDTIREGILTHDDTVWLGSAFAVRRSLARLDEFAAFVKSLPEPESLYQDWPLAFWCASLPQELAMAFSPRKLCRYRLHTANHSGDTRTAARAARNFHRAATTLDAMLAIARLRELGEDKLARLKALSSVYRWQSFLYQSGGSVPAYLKVVPLLARERMLLRESARFAGIRLLGRARFAQLASAGRRSRRATAKDRIQS
jgi:hypothetical protein